MYVSGILIPFDSCLAVNGETIIDHVLMTQERGDHVEALLWGSNSTEGGRHCAVTTTEFADDLLLEGSPSQSPALPSNKSKGILDGRDGL